MQPAPPRPAARLVDLGLQLLPARHAEAVAVAARARPARAQPARKLVAAQVRQHRAAAGLGVQQALRGQDALRARDRDRVRVGQPPTSRRDFMRADVPAGTRRARARLRCARKPMRGSQGGDSALRGRAGQVRPRSAGPGAGARLDPGRAQRVVGAVERGVVGGGDLAQCQARQAALLALVHGKVGGERGALLVRQLPRPAAGAGRGTRVSLGCGRAWFRADGSNDAGASPGIRHLAAMQ